MHSVQTSECFYIMLSNIKGDKRIMRNATWKEEEKL